MHKFRTYTKPWILRETAPSRQKRAAKILRILKKTYPAAKIALRYKTHWQLLVAVQLSAQCTDKKVNEITPALFRRFKTVADFASADTKELEQLIKSSGFYRNKARNLIAAAQKVQADFGGKLPRTMAKMVTIPGIARKSANVILGNAYGVVEGIAVDTHVGRIAQRWGLVDTDNPVKVEKKLMALIPKKEWYKFTYRTIDHGRAICTAQRRKCSLCPLKDICPSSLV